jgi:hypothetical protein
VVLVCKKYHELLRRESRFVKCIGKNFLLQLKRKNPGDFEQGKKLFLLSFSGSSVIVPV